MQSTWRVVRAVAVFLGVATTLGASTSVAQMAASGGQSLGGYGGSTTDTGSGMGMGGPFIPYAGKFGGFMPYRMGGGSLSFQSRGTSPTGSGRTSFSLSPMSGGMSSMSGGLGAGSRTFSSFGTQGAVGPGGGSGMVGGMNQTSGTRGMGVMPPSFGYPFRQPPSLLSPSSSGTGMSM
jgi:hypothetical protein